MFIINFKALDSLCNVINQTYNTNVALVTYSDKNNCFATTKVFKNYVKLYVNDKIALEIKFDKNTFEFKEFMHNAKRSDYIAERLLNTFSVFKARVTKKQCFIQCDCMNNDLMLATILFATKFANEYDAELDNAKLAIACHKALKSVNK